MTVKFFHNRMSRGSLMRFPGLCNSVGDIRIKRIIQRVLKDSVRWIEYLKIIEDEFWRAVGYSKRLSSRGELGLLDVGLGLEHFLDLLQDAKGVKVGMVGGTSRIIEGPTLQVLHCLTRRRGWITEAEKG